MGSQLGKTEGLLNIIGHRLDDDPVPIIYVGPTQANVTRIIEPRLAKMLQSAESLWAKTAKGKEFSKAIKRVNGVDVRLAWAGSPSELASQAAGIGLVDEYDRMTDIPGEGSVLGMVQARLATYPGSKLIVDSTPTVGRVDTYIDPASGMERWAVSDPEEIHSPTWKLWQEGTRHEWAVPCQHCGEYFVPRFSLLNWPSDSSPEKAEREARLACPRCGGLHEDKQKKDMNAAGLLVAPGQTVEDGEVVGDPPETDTFSVWVSGLMSPWVSWGQRAMNWLRAARSRDQGRIQTELNTSFGELYVQSGDAPSWESVRECCGGYRRGEVPDFVQWIFLSVDVQKDRLEWTVRGWGSPQMKSALIDWGQLYGETDRPDVWESLHRLVERQWNGQGIKAFAVDAGYRADEVYYFVSHYPGRGYATHGKMNHRKLFSATPVETNRSGKVLKSGVKIWTFDTHHFKSWVHSRLTWPIDEPGAWLVPDDVDDDYCQQVTAEALMTTPAGRHYWTKIRRDNHQFDTEVLQALLAQILNVRTLLDEPSPKKASSKLSDLARRLNDG